MGGKTCLMFGEGLKSYGYSIDVSVVDVINVLWKVLATSTDVSTCR